MILIFSLYIIYILYAIQSCSGEYFYFVLLLEQIGEKLFRILFIIIFITYLTILLFYERVSHIKKDLFYVHCSV